MLGHPVLRLFPAGFFDVQVPISPILPTLMTEDDALRFGNIHACALSHAFDCLRPAQFIGSLETVIQEQIEFSLRNVRPTAHSSSTSRSLASI